MTVEKEATVVEVEGAKIPKMAAEEVVAEANFLEVAVKVV